MANSIKYMPNFDESVNPYIAKSKSYPSRIYSQEAILSDNTDSSFQKLINSDKIFCEFGSGSGIHLLSLAKGNLDAACIGFELRYKRAVRTIEKSSEVQNTFVFRADYNVADQVFKSQSLDGLHVNFPDPWAKKKWHKNRILNKSFIIKAQSLLKQTGYLKVKTDHQEYFETFFNTFQNTSSKFELVEVTRDLISRKDIHSYTTEFEQLFKSKNLPIYYLEARLK